MPEPTDFLQTADGDLDFSQGLQRTPDLITFTKQKLSETLNFWVGEWFLDLRAGVPYLRVIGQRPDLSLLQDMLRKACLLTPGVGSVQKIAAVYDGRTRTATVQPLGVRTIDGDPVPVGPLVLEGFG